MLRRTVLSAAFSCLLAFFAKAATFPRPAPEFTIEQSNGPALKISQYKGHPVVVAFILTTCSHCQRTTGYLVNLHNEFAARGVQILECAIEPLAKANVGNFSKTYLTPFPVGYSNNTTGILDFLQHPTMKVPHMPLLAFIDAKGNIREQHEGDEDAYFGPNQEQNLRASIEALMKDPAPAKKAPASKTAPKKTR
jgi:peroxiredoxin